MKSDITNLPKTQFHTLSMMKKTCKSNHFQQDTSQNLNFEKTNVFQKHFVNISYDTGVWRSKVRKHYLNLVYFSF